MNRYKETFFAEKGEFYVCVLKKEGEEPILRLYGGGGKEFECPVESLADIAELFKKADDWTKGKGEDDGRNP